MTRNNDSDEEQALQHRNRFNSTAHAAFRRKCLLHGYPCYSEPRYPLYLEVLKPDGVGIQLEFARMDELEAWLDLFPEGQFIPVSKATGMSAAASERVSSDGLTQLPQPDPAGVCAGNDSSQ